MSDDDKLKHKPQTKHTLSEVLKSLQDLIRNDLVPTKVESPAPLSTAPQKTSTLPPAREPDSFHDALDQLDHIITHNIIEPVERARETPLEPLLPDEEIEIEWEDDDKSAAPIEETIEAAPPPTSAKTIDLASLEPETAAVEIQSADADERAVTEIEVELAPPPADPTPEPVAHTEGVVEATGVSQSAESQAPTVSDAQDTFPFSEPQAEDEVPTLDLAAVDSASLEELTLTLEATSLETHPAAAETEKPPTLELEPEHPREAAPTTAADTESHAPPPPVADKKNAPTPADSNVIEWQSPSLTKTATPHTATPKAVDAAKTAAPSPPKPAAATTSTPKPDKAQTSAAPPSAPRPVSPATPTSPSVAARPEPPKRPAEPPRAAPPKPQQPATKPPAPKQAATKPLSPVERAIKQAAPPELTVGRSGQEPARPASPTSKTVSPPGQAKPASPATASKPAAATQPPAKPATKPVAPEQTEIPVLKEIAELAALSATPLPEPEQARDIAIRVIARLNIERRKAGEMPLDIKTIERLQQYLAEALAKRALNQPK
ncbi:MAG: hypothetical protein ACJ8KO_05115 [Sulfurifustaceae bacterium]